MFKSVFFTHAKVPVLLQEQSSVQLTVRRGHVVVGTDGTTLSKGNAKEPLTI